MSLFQLTSEQRQLMEMIDREELTQEQAQDTLDMLADDVQEGVTSLCHAIRYKEADLNALDAEIERLSKLKKTRKNQIDRMKGYMLAVMNNAGESKIESALFKVSTRKGRQSLKVTDQSKIPLEYIDVEVVEKPDKKAITAAIKAGEQFEGCELVEGEKTLIIK